MSIDASVVSNFFLEKSHKEKIPLCQMKLMKLVYIAHGWSLAVLNKGVLDEEEVQAWQYGPVVPSIYHEFKGFGKNNINQYSRTLIFEEDDGFKTKPKFLDDILLTKKEKNRFETIWNTVWDSYKNYSGVQLSQKTHEKGTPWEKAHNKGEKVISKESIRSYYDTFLTEYQTDES